MAKLLAHLWSRARGKWHVERICNKVFDDCSEDKASLKLEKLHVATLMVYNSVNKQLLNPHKEPPSKKTVEKKVEELKKKKETINGKETISTQGQSQDSMIGPGLQSPLPLSAPVSTSQELQLNNEKETINRAEFQKLIMEWIRKDLNVELANRALLAFVAAPALAVATKRATKDVPHVGEAVEKVPTPLLFSLFSVGLVLLQDLRVG